MLEDTPHGQNTFHGTVIVLNQREDKGAKVINSPLSIPHTLPAKPLKVTLDYRDEPTIQKKPIRFQELNIGKREHLGKKYSNFTHTWLLANFLANETAVVDENFTVELVVPLNEEDADVVTQDPVCENSILNLTDESCKDMAVAKKILQVTHKKEKKAKVEKTDVMPTWAATQSLLLSKTETFNKRPVNTEAIAPLFKTSPTDYATLYTVLCLTQEISASVVGPDRRTLITLDLDLYNRAIQIQESVGHKNWILFPGGLHVCFAIEYALGKTIEGSGIDTCAIECGTYTAAALRGIYSGKAFKRAVEYHLISALAIMMMKFESLSVDLFTPELQLQCHNLKIALHGRDPSMTSLFDGIQHEYLEKIQEKLDCRVAGDLGQYLDQYLVQLDNLLRIIRSCREEDWQGYLASLECGIKYFFAHDLFNYARLMPVHIAQMNDLERDDPAVWECLKSGDFAVNKSGIPFSSLFTDQALEQEIKHLKRHGGIVGLSQNEDALDRMMYTTPHLSKIVKNYL